MSTEVQESRKERAEFVMLEIANRSGKQQEEPDENDMKFLSLLNELNTTLFE